MNNLEPAPVAHNYQLWTMYHKGCLDASLIFNYKWCLTSCHTKTNLFVHVFSLSLSLPPSNVFRTCQKSLELPEGLIRNKK